MKHTFLYIFCRCCARLLRKTSRNFLVTRFMEGMSDVFLFTLFFHCRSFSPWWPLASRRYKISFCSSDRNCLLLFFSLSRYLLFSLSFANLSPYFLFFSVFPFFYIPNLWTLQLILSLILKKKKTRIQKHFPLSVFVFIDSLVVSASQDAGGHTLSCQNNLTFGIGLHVVGVQTVVRTLRHNQIFSDG